MGRTNKSHSFNTLIEDIDNTAGDLIQVIDLQMQLPSCCG